MWRNHFIENERVCNRRKKKTNPHPTGILTVHTKQCRSNFCLLLLSKPVPCPRNCFILLTFMLLFMYCSSFKQFLELEPQLRDILHSFYDSKYANCLKLLADIKDNLLLDLYLAPHVAPLYTQIRNRALCQVSAELFNMTLCLASLCMQETRIRSENKSFHNSYVALLCS